MTLCIARQNEYKKREREKKEEIKKIRQERMKQARKRQQEKSNEYKSFIETDASASNTPRKPASSIAMVPSAVLAPTPAPAPAPRSAAQTPGGGMDTGAE